MRIKISLGLVEFNIDNKIILNDNKKSINSIKSYTRVVDS